ncbi:hypothetical protein [Cerasicoccus frondis]|uniref:hypothetical protein n=1 Tax=Cerasicoccus frondis TaxID=490090 RepID=UPI002852666D|nr:hypothetical protein [Cerasicoccus frondis]
MNPAFPAELITLVGSSLMGGVMKMWAMSNAARREERLLAMQALNQQAGHIDSARRYSNPGFQWTRRVIALTCVFSVIALPKIIAIWRPDILMQVGYPEIEEGFWFFTNDVEKIHWKEVRGLTITPLDTHLLSAIVGLYFGGSLAGHNRF